MIIFFVGILGFITVVYLLSKNKYDHLIKDISTKEYPFKSFFPLALYLLDKLNYKYITKYDRRLFQRMIELYGIKDAKKFLVIHWANKISTMIISLLILSLLGMGLDEVDKVHIFFSIFVLAGLIYGTDKDLTNKIKKKHIFIKLDFPDFLNKLTLLIDAGMTVSSAWKKIVLDSDSQRALYYELRLTVIEINSGKSEREAYENFAKRCRIPEVTKFVSVILQNLRKGNSELTSILRLQGNECWEMRKDVAKRLGEEASTKLLIPIGIMFIAILIIAVAPALLQLKGF